MAPISFPFFNMGTLSSDLARKSSAVATRHGSPSAYAGSARIDNVDRLLGFDDTAKASVRGAARHVLRKFRRDAKLGERGIGAVPVGKQIEIRVDGQMGVGKALSHEAIFGSEVLAISIPRNRGLPVIRHFQERMLYGLFVPEVP